MSELLIERAGPLSTVQDLGRPGHADLGVPPSGALDGPSLRRANTLVGNPEDAAGLELTLGGLRARFGRTAVIALTGAPAPARLGGRAIAHGAAVVAEAGERLVVGAPRTGVRTYLAIAGGITLDPVLGSRSTDLLSGLGPPALADGDRLPLGEQVGRTVAEPGPPSNRQPGRACAERGGAADGPVLVRVRIGPRDAWLAPGAPERLCAEPYTVRPESNRIGLRLAGAALAHRPGLGDLPSEGVITGAIQVPPDGQPIVLLADHPTTGGYPVIAVVDESDLPRLAQARPGARVRFARDLGAP